MSATMPLNRITYVDDDADIRAIAQIALEDIGGFDVQLCAAGAEAIEKTPDFGPDIVILDVRMPGMDGAATFASLKAIPALAKTPVIFMTANGGAEATRALLRQGAVGVISKPFDPVRLADDLRAIWRSLKNGRLQ